MVTLALPQSTVAGRNAGNDCAVSMAVWWYVFWNAMANGALSLVEYASHALSFFVNAKLAFSSTMTVSPFLDVVKR